MNFFNLNDEDFIIPALKMDSQNWLQYPASLEWIRKLEGTAQHSSYQIFDYIWRHYKKPTINDDDA